MTIGSLFSGIGGLDLGLERAGHTVRWQVESNAYCRAILNRHWPTVPCHDNVTTLTGQELAPVDIICGGFPCQPVSHAGLQRGAIDDRWLWPNFARLLGVLRPRYALLENVPGLLTANGGREFGHILADLADGGYDAEWDCLPASAIGAPHLRYRVFIIATLADSNRTGPQGRELLPQRPGERVIGEDSLGTRFFDAPIGGEWVPEPDVGRVAHGVPKRVDRLKTLGNAVVPQVAEWLGRRLSGYASARKSG